MPQRILVVRLGSMGDIVHTLPAVIALRNAFPNAHIGWTVEQRWTPLLAAEGSPPSGMRGPERPLVDQVHVVNTLAWRKALLSVGTWREIRAAVSDLRIVNYEVAFDFQGTFKSAVLAQLSRAPIRIGFDRPREKPATMSYTTRVEAVGQHIIEQNLSLIRTIVSGASGISFSLPIDSAAETKVSTELAAHDGREFALISPGGGWGAKCWAPERYGEVARGLDGLGVQSLINYGPGEERLAREVERYSQGAAKAVLCSIGELLALTRRARLFIGGDTGPMHLAAAFGVPVVAIFGPTDPARNGPFAREDIVVRRLPPCAPCYSRTCARHAGIMAGIGVGEVLSAAERRLAAAREGASRAL